MNKEIILKTLHEYEEWEGYEYFTHWLKGYIDAQSDDKDWPDLIDQINERSLDGYKINLK